ncbi:cytochrome P450 3A7 [Metarhizium album ARSEF 1941]|uniref:Cytochrome P450 3A7 n=1 Tax=Metarhizium album (strain ARSEF 1941) TaxID=1081103 RepID=A0A0B2WTY0_METAS|nr:cytochrome P450 3A7 [Metarhizium album ARSEF 1941]KHN96375.1 cytochrome P450 3A7 [Metarhizium album ARSEF 1941]
MLARHWLVLAPIYAKLIRLLPKSWWDDWLDLMIPDAAYRLDRKRYTRHGDTFALVSPGAIMIQTANADVIRQIITQREKFPKPCQIYRMLRLFGENVVTTEGNVWKAHRKATSPSFNEKNSALVFREIIEQTKGMMGTWVDDLGNRSEPLTTISADITRLTINVISYVGFGLRLLWPGQDLPPGVDVAAAKYASLDPPPGYSFSFVDTLVRLLNDILIVLLLPSWLLKLSPWKGPRLAAAAYQDYVRYSNEMMNEKMRGVENGTQTEEGMDFMGALIKGSYGLDAKGTAGNVGRTRVLNRDEILGNAFIMFVAGHETSANTIHFTLINLATNPAAQRLIHKDVDELVGNSDPSTWDYERLIGPMTGSAIAACMNETLRLIPPGPAIPKQVSRDRDQVVNVDGVECLLPKGSLVMLQVLKAHEDARHWPCEESRLTPGQDDLRDYKPERWFETTPGPRRQGKTDETDEKGTRWTESSDGFDGGDDESDEGIDRKPDSSVRFFRPRRGAYLPFSDGARSCIGRRVAQVEIMTFLTVLFQRYSLELAVDQWASEEEVQRMSRDARAEVYRTAQARSRRTLAEAKSVITLGLQGKTVPMRLVKRGEEKFINWMSDA